MATAPQGLQEKCLYVEDIRADTGTVRDWFLIARVEQKSSTRGDFLVFKFSDRTGTIPGVWFDSTFETCAARAGQIVKVLAKTSDYNGKPQLQVERMFVPPPGGNFAPDGSHFFKASRYDPHILWQDCHDMVANYTSGDINALLDAVLTDDEVKALLLKAPAAVKYHHAYLTGLLEHSWSLMGAAIALNRHYRFNLPIVLAGCLLHDIGKCWELEFTRETKYSVQGCLHGHINIGFTYVARLCAELNVDEDTAAHILHLIASHHGTKEQGSPVEPATREALVFHALDRLDATLGAIDAALELPAEEDGDYTPFIPSLKGRMVRKFEPNQCLTEVAPKGENTCP